MNTLQTTKLQQLLDQIKQSTEVVLPIYTTPQYSPGALVKQELFEIVKYGYWPVKFLETQNHWLAEGEPLDECAMTLNGVSQEPVCGYTFSCRIVDDIVIHLTIEQGNVLEVDGQTKLTFSCYSLITDTGDDILIEEYNINGLSQLDSIIDSKWGAFISNAWPIVDAELDKYVKFYSSRCENRDSEIHLDLVKFAWDRFNQDLKKDLINCIFYDWSALDTIEAWIKK